MTAAWTIAPFEGAHQQGVIGLISGIQRGEYNLPITPADQPDLMDIPGFYLNSAQGPGGFWVALDPRGAVAGTIAALNIGPDAVGRGQGALRKMFVAREQRGTGLAAALLETLAAWCAGPAIGIGALFLGTTDRFLAAHRFYEKHGFSHVAKACLPPSFPVMAVDTVFYTRRLG
ncbi:MAG: GNAT family N-acetyltransferase [Humidesulfovibrio sp.]|nr:GNAT family N-acetyltransferase [Humidesulfovibrio sp.]